MYDHYYQGCKAIARDITGNKSAIADKQFALFKSALAVETYMYAHFQLLNVICMRYACILGSEVFVILQRSFLLVLISLVKSVMKTKNRIMLSLFITNFMILILKLFSFLFF